MAVVQLDIQKFMDLYPEFSNIPDSIVTATFTKSSLFINNTDCSVECDLAIRELLIYACMAHLIYLRYGDNNGNGGNGLTGRISEAVEGDVSVKTELNLPQSAAWYSQSPYGVDLWQMLLPYRSFMYVP